MESLGWLRRAENRKAFGKVSVFVVSGEKKLKSRIPQARRQSALNACSCVRVSLS
jgi:hypothetical protein